MNVENFFSSSSINLIIFPFERTRITLFLHTFLTNLRKSHVLKCLHNYILCDEQLFSLTSKRDFSELFIKQFHNLVKQKWSYFDRTVIIIILDYWCNGYYFNFEIFLFRLSSTLHVVSLNYMHASTNHT